jgi:hypothetical protein
MGDIEDDEDGPQRPFTQEFNGDDEVGRKGIILFSSWLIYS